MLPSDTSVGQDAGIDTLQNVSSMPELCDLIPPAYRTTLSEQLRVYHNISQKISDVQQTLETLNKHKSENTFPQTVLAAIKLPNVQYSNEYHSSASASLEKATLRYRVDLLSCLITNKTNELATLQALMVFRDDEWKAECTRIGEHLASTLGIKVATIDDGLSCHFRPSTAELIADFNRVNVCGERWHARAVSLAYVALGTTTHTSQTIEDSIVREMMKLSLGESTDIVHPVTDTPPKNQTAQALEEDLLALKPELLKEIRATNLAKKSGGIGLVKKNKKEKKENAGRIQKGNGSARPLKQKNPWKGRSGAVTTFVLCYLASCRR